MFRAATLVFLLVSLSLFTGTANAVMHLHPLESPNKDFKLVVAVGPINDVQFALFYKEELLAKASRFSFALTDGDQLPATMSFRLGGGIFQSAREPKPSRYAPNSTSVSQVMSIHSAENNVDYNEMSVHYWKLEKGSEEYESLIKIVFRAYNDGIAYRYEIATKAGEPITIKNENVEFVFPDDYTCTVSETMTAGIFSRRTVSVGRVTSLSKLKTGTANPLYIEFRKGALKMEMSLSGIPRADFAPLQFQPGRELTGTFNNLYERFGNIDRTGKRTAVALLLEGDTEIHGTGNPYHTPWRAMVLSYPHGEKMLQSLIAP